MLAEQLEHEARLQVAEGRGRPADGGLTVTDDGFAFFDSTPGPAPWVNTPIPSDVDPNDMLAPFWSDWFINFELAAGFEVATDAIKERFGAPSDVEVARPGNPSVVGHYIDGSRVMSFGSVDGKVTTVILTTKGPRR